MLKEHHARPANITQSHSYNQTLFHLVKQDRQFRRPHQASALAQVPAPPRPLILLISMSGRFHSSGQKQARGRRARAGTTNPTVRWPRPKRLVHTVESRMQASMNINTSAGHPHHGHANMWVFPRQMRVCKYETSPSLTKKVYLCSLCPRLSCKQEGTVTHSYPDYSRTHPELHLTFLPWYLAALIVGNPDFPKHTTIYFIPLYDSRGDKI